MDILKTKFCDDCVFSKAVLVSDLKFLDCIEPNFQKVWDRSKGTSTDDLKIVLEAVQKRLPNFNLQEDNHG